MIIGFGHKKRVGKDTAAKFCLSILRDNPRYRGKGVTRRGFADPLYDVCYKLYSWAGFQRREYYDEHPAAKEVILPELGKTPRKILIDVGTPVFRSYDDNVWINAALRANVPDVMCVPDVRFINEALTIQKLGGVAVKVNNPRAAASHDIADDGLNGFTGWDHVIENDGTLNELHSKCVHLLQILELI